MKVSGQDLHACKKKVNYRPVCNERLIGSSSGSPLKRQLEYLQWEDGEMGSACEWVGQVSSQLRISLYPEEVAEGFMADAARGTLWKVCTLQSVNPPVKQLHITDLFRILK